jgi:hypothetical protein
MDSAKRQCTNFDMFFGTTVLGMDVKCTLAKGKAIPLQAWTGPKEVEAPRFLDSRHLKVVRLSALRTGRVYSPGNIPGTHFC